MSLDDWTWQFPDDVIDDAANFCRNPDHKPLGPWCYYGNGKDEWGYCDVTLCPGNVSVYYCAFSILTPGDECVYFYETLCVGNGPLHYCAFHGAAMAKGEMG